MNKLVWLIALVGLFVGCSQVASSTEYGFSEPASNVASSSLIDEDLVSDQSNSNSENPQLIVPKMVSLTGVGSTYQIEPRVIGATAVAYEYLTESESVVEVNATGEIEVIMGGLCKIYVMAQLESGFWLFEEISVYSPTDVQQVIYN